MPQSKYIEEVIGQVTQWWIYLFPLINEAKADRPLFSTITQQATTTAPTELLILGPLRIRIQQMLSQIKDQESKSIHKLMVIYSSPIGRGLFPYYNQFILRLFTTLPTSSDLT